MGALQVAWTSLHFQTIIVLIFLLGVVSSKESTCMDRGGGEFTCTDDVVASRHELDGYDIGLGVTQRIDGSDLEKKAIRDVLRLMEDYITNEVLSMPEYESARPHCKNTNELCAFWSAVGECESNRVFMLGNCPAACRFCLLLHSNLA